MTTAQLESELQSQVLAHAESRGWFVEKIMRTARRGFPDIYLLRHGHHILIEMKREGEVPTVQQKKRHREIREHGGEVYVVDNLDDAKRILK